MQILVIDVGGTNIKVLATGRRQPVKIPSGPTMTARAMVAAVRKASANWKYTGVSIGYPGPVIDNLPLIEPRNLGKGWVTFDFAKAFGHPVKLINDAAMQAPGSYEGGRMLFLGLGTGLGSALIVEGHIAPMELAHLPYKHGETFEDYVGRRGLERLGKKRWQHHVGGWATTPMPSAVDFVCGPRTTSSAGGIQSWVAEEGAQPSIAGLFSRLRILSLATY